MLHPVLPTGAVLIFDGLTPWAFGRNAGPRIWYDEDSIQVYLKEDLEVRPDGQLAVVDAKLFQAQAAMKRGSGLTIPLIRESTFFFRLEGGHLREVPWDDMYRSVASR